MPGNSTPAWLCVLGTSTALHQEPGSKATSQGAQRVGSGEPSAGVWGSPVRCKATRHKGLGSTERCKTPNFKKMML